MAALARRAAASQPGRKLVDALREEGGPQAAAAVPAEPPLDGWLNSLFGERLEALDAACAGGGIDAYANFRDLDDDLWALLLSRNYASYPNIAALLPDVPDPSLQERWNGASGLALLTQSKAFYSNVNTQMGRHGRPLEEARVLDFGCGWGRLTRFLARDVAPGNLLGCDPVDEILDICRTSRVPAELALSDFVPESLPFDGLDLVYSFSVFTHISEEAHLSCLRAIHGALKPGGLLMLTIRPPDYLELDPKMHGALAELGGDPVAATKGPKYVFVPHEPDPDHPQYDGGEMTYGDTTFSLGYVRECWSEWFDLLDVRAPVEDPYQVAVTLRRR